MTAVLCEVAAQKTGSSVWMMLAAAVAVAGFVLAWQRQDELRLLPVLVLTLVFQLAWIAVDLHLGVSSLDSAVLYRRWGNALLHGHYPDAQYPPGAVLLFAFDALLGGGPTRTSHAFVMIPFQLVTVASVWALRTDFSRWLAALVALWPLDAFFWEFRFDLAPTALLAVGLLFAVKERWGLSGALLGLGAALKWTPGIAFALLAVWLLGSRRFRACAVYALAFVAVFALLHVPFLLWSPHETAYAYRYFSSQGITGESVWYLLLAPVGHATVNLHEFWLPADVPGWADPATEVVQALSLFVLAASVIRVRARLRPAVAIAAVAPVVFLLLNRVFSPQYLVLILACWAIAGALALRSRREQLVLGLGAIVATTANAFVYPYILYQHNLWRVSSLVLFATGLCLCGWLVALSIRPADTRAAERI
jgi:Glycosyltransferase family 87